MVKGIGVDIVDIDRFKNINNDQDFINQILNDYEIPVVLTRIPKHVQIAKAFALKEAMMKALGTGLYYGSYWHNIEISELWEIKLSGFLKNISDEMKINKINSSTVQTKNYVSAVVILEGYI
ncbi:MAG: holo-ACP synthase [Bacteroidota bacterium]|nr:holo-ACP synthase [Bacteroidota bacterium]